MDIAKASGTDEVYNINSFEDISSDIKSVFSADTCVEKPGYLNCSHPDGRSAYLVGAPDANNNGTIEPTELQVYNTGMYLIHVNFTSSECTVELVNGICDCTYCAVEEGEFGIMSQCGESQTEYHRLKTGECVQISDISEGRVMEGDEEAIKTMSQPPFYRLVTELEDAFSEEHCTKGFDKESYKEQLPNGTFVYKTRRFLEMNCSLDGREAYVNKTDDAGVEILGRLVITSETDPNVKVSFDFEANTCSVEADGAPCSNCTTCKHNDDKDYGISASCPNAQDNSPFSGGGGTCLPVVELVGGALTHNFNGTTANSTTPTYNDTADGDSADETNDVWEEDPNNPDNEGSTDADDTDKEESDGEGSGGEGEVDTQEQGDSNGSDSDGTPKEIEGTATTSSAGCIRVSWFVLLFASLPIAAATA
jgi:hypothetical protein